MNAASGLPGPRPAVGRDNSTQIPKANGEGKGRAAPVAHCRKQPQHTQNRSPNPRLTPARSFGDEWTHGFRTSRRFKAVLRLWVAIIFLLKFLHPLFTRIEVSRLLSS